MEIKTLVFEYTRIREGYYLLTLKEEENPNRFINHPLQFSFVNNPNSHFKKHSKLLPMVDKCKSI